MTAYVVDTSVAVPALVAEHPEHPACDAVVAALHPPIAGHASIEAYAVITRLPTPGQLPGSEVLRLLRSSFPDVVWPSVTAVDGFVAHCAGQGIVGGAVYDALVALAASGVGATLITTDLRARRTYRSMGVDFVTPEQLL